MMAATANEKLITLVQQHPCLFDPGDKDYKNLVKKQYIWDKIAKEINHNREATKMKWKNLKDGYTKYKNQTNGTSQKKSYLHWIWGPNLQFLDNVKKMKRRTTEPDDFVLTEDVMNSPARSTNSDSGVLQAYMEEDSQEASASVASTNQTSSPQPKKRKNDDAVLDYLRNLRRSDRDAVDHLFASYAETFKKLKPRTQAALKLKLAQIFAEAEISDIDSDNSVPLITAEYPVYMTGPHDVSDSGFDSHSQLTPESEIKVKEEFHL